MPEMMNDPQAEVGKSGREWTLLGILAASLTSIFGVAAILHYHAARSTAASIDDFFSECQRLDHFEFILFVVVLARCASLSCILLFNGKRLSLEMGRLANSGSRRDLLAIAMRTLALSSLVLALFFSSIALAILRLLPLLQPYESLLFLGNGVTLLIALARKKWRLSALLGFNLFLLGGSLFLPVF